MKKQVSNMFHNQKMQVPETYPTTLESGSLGYSWEMCILKSVTQLILIINNKLLLWTKSVYKVEVKQQLTLRI